SNFYAGSMTADNAKKTTRFVKLCETFHLPILTFVDEPGFLIGPEAEKEGTILHGTEAVLAVAETTVPWATILVRKTFGVAAAAHFGSDPYVLSWPSSESGALPLEGGVAIAFAKEIANSDDPDKKRKEIETELAKDQNPFSRAESFSVHEIIDPSETRKYLCKWIERIQPQLKTRLNK
ncbi:propionyl-CoA carboxylase, partial [SAR86 cluster bacterium]|nr:propionyl-CoA carboxylase [SAR86 cluster bacterium]